MVMIERYPAPDATEADAPVLIGHSHSECVFKAAKAAGTPLAGFNFWTAPQPAMNAERTAFHPEIADRLSRGRVFSAVGGGVHTTIGMVRHPVAFDFVLPEDPDLPIEEGAMIVPHAVIRDLIAHHLAEYLQVIALVRAAATGRVHHFAAPPPPEDGARMQPEIPWDFFPGMTREVSPAPLRYKLWRVTMSLTAEFCARHDVIFVPRPPEVADDRGYLRPEYYGDATHVNERYGALVLAQIEALR